MIILEVTCHYARLTTSTTELTRTNALTHRNLTYLLTTDHAPPLRPHLPDIL